ncbi:MAG: hypothetical protein ACR2IF_12250 [Terriglobales bacterium]
MEPCTDLRQHPHLCPALRWKGQFVLAEHDPSAQTGSDASYWCMYTQTCVGPDGMLAEPALCASPIRACHGSGRCA